MAPEWGPPALERGRLLPTVQLARVQHPRRLRGCPANLFPLWIERYGAERTERTWLRSHSRAFEDLHLGSILIVKR